MKKKGFSNKLKTVTKESCPCCDAIRGVITKTTAKGNIYKCSKCNTTWCYRKPIVNAEK